MRDAVRYLDGVSGVAAAPQVCALLLEASAERRRAIQEHLAVSQLSVTLEVAEDPLGFSKALGSRRCSLVLAGTGLEGLGELRALERVKREQPEVPVILLGDPREEGLVVEALQHGASDYVSFGRLERLIPAVSRALREREERAGRRRAGEALEFSARASTELATSLDFTTTVERVARLAVPFLGGFCAVDILEDGRIHRRAECALDDFPPELLSALVTVTDFPGDAFWAGRLQALPKLVGTDLPQGEDARALHEAGLASLIRLPLRAQGRALGVLTIAAALPHSPHSPATLPLAEDYSHRASLALDAARLHGELQRSDQRKDEFLAMLAHELRNPLASILAALELSRVRDDFSRLDRPLLSAERQAKHMARILDDLLDISRITRGKIELRRQPSELNAVVRDAVTATRSRAEGRGLRLDVDLCPEPLQLFADPDRIEQVLANLLSNGTKFTKPGGRLWLSTSREGAEAVLRVRDTGVGISPEMLPRIFDLFVQANPSLDRAEGGLGLGLTLVKKLTELHGGSVVAVSEGVGRGSEFAVRLPLTSHAHTGPKPVSPVLPEVRAHLRVLLVDDNQDLRESTGELLRILEHEVVEAADGDEAVRHAQEQPFDVAFVDLGLPGLNGYAVARALRDMEDGSKHRTALVALTGYSQPEHRRRTLQAGFDEHLTKPLDFAQLREVLNRFSSLRPEMHVPAALAGWTEHL